MKTNFFQSLFVSFLLALSARAADPAISRAHEVRLKDFKGQTFLAAMIAEDGVKAQFDADYVESYEAADFETVEAQLKNFDTKTVKRVLGSFSDGKKGFEKLVDSLQGQRFSPSEIFELIRANVSRGDTYALAQVIAMASGAGTLVVIDENNYYYNYGYKSGADRSEDVKSGRSFGAGPLHNANDASDVMYLNELEQYLNETNDLAPFYQAILKVLIQCDPSGFKKLSPLGQTVATDFIAIYTAESDRHLMVDLKPNSHPWENDLAGSTFVSAFGSAVGKIMKDGLLKEGKAREWWAMSALGNGRSGIGITRNDRKKLQKMISSYVREKNPAQVREIESVIGKRRDGDLFQGLMEFLNHYDNQKIASTDGSFLIDSFSKILALTQSEASHVEAHILDHLDQ